MRYSARALSTKTWLTRFRFMAICFHEHVGNLFDNSKVQRKTGYSISTYTE